MDSKQIEDTPPENHQNRVDLANQEVSQRNKGNTDNHAEGCIPDKAPEIPALQHHQRLLREGGEGRKATADTHSQEQRPVASLSAILAEHAPEKANQ